MSTTALAQPTEQFDPSRDFDGQTNAVGRWSNILHSLATVLNIHLPQVIRETKPPGNPLDRLVKLAANNCKSGPATIRGFAVSYDHEADTLKVTAPADSTLPSGEPELARRVSPAFERRS